MSITIDVDEVHDRIINANAEASGVSVSEYVLGAVLRRMEDEQDYREAEAAYFRWLENPVTIDHEQAAMELGLR